MLMVNERPVPFRPGMRLAELVAAFKPDADVLIVNGHPAVPDSELADGDHCWLIRRGERPSAKELARLLHARHTPGVHQRLARACVGIMGLGGLGSAVAVALARMGVGRLILADYDVVEPSNLNRQQYFVDQVGMAKTEAMQANLARMNPAVEVRCVHRRLTGEDIGRLFREVDVLVECFDDPTMKATALRAALTRLAGVGYVTASGVAGYDDNNLVRTTRLFPGVYMVGDGRSAAAPGQGLMAARVGIAAHHQANQVVRLLLGADAEEEDCGDDCL